MCYFSVCCFLDTSTTPLLADGYNNGGDIATKNVRQGSEEYIDSVEEKRQRINDINNVKYISGNENKGDNMGIRMAYESEKTPTKTKRFINSLTRRQTPDEGKTINIDTSNKENKEHSNANNNILLLIKKTPFDPRVISLIAIVLLLFLLFIFCLVCRYFSSVVKIPSSKEKLNLKEEHLFGPDYNELIRCRMDEFEYNIDEQLADVFEEIKLGQIKFSLAYINDENLVLITIHEAKDIPAADICGTSDAFVKVIFKRKGSKKEFKTKVLEGTLFPVFEETFMVKKVTYPRFAQSSLLLQVFDYDRFGGSDLLGELLIHVKDLNFSKGPVSEWRLLKPEFKSEVSLLNKYSGLGHICIGLGYSANLGYLAIFVLSCQGLPPVDDDGLADPYVTIFLVQGGRKMKKRKTTVKMKTLDPTFNERYAFDVAFDAINDTSVLFVVADYDKGQFGDPIGQCLIGSLGVGLGVKHWEKIRKSPGKVVCVWHMLKTTQLT